MSKAEFACRFQRQLGKNALFPFAFHCTGMPIQASANRLKREIETGTTSSNQPSEQELKALKKANPKYEKPPYTQYEILQRSGIPEADIPAFTDSNHWLSFFPPLGQDTLKRFGIMADWRRSFITTARNPYYDSFIRWQFHHLRENGKIKYGKRYAIFSELDGQPCADHDRSKGEGVGPQEYTGIKIQLLDFPESLSKWSQEKVYLLAATLRPETMYGQTNCFVKPDGEYGLYEMKNGEFFIVSERAARNLAYQEKTAVDKKYPALAKVKGAEIIGKKLKAPLTSYEFVYALPLPTIKMDKGTGVVTSVPSDSPDDFMMMRDLQTKEGLRKILNVEEEWVKGFDPIPLIDIPNVGNISAQFWCEHFKVASYKDADGLAKAKDKCYGEGFREGVMLVGLGAGKKVEDVKVLVKQHMIESGMAIPYNEPESEVISRSGDNCIVALCDQWLLGYGEAEWLGKVKEHVYGTNFQTYNPKTAIEFRGVLDWLKEWGCSRTQGLGTVLPWDNQFLIESLSDSTIYMAYYTVAGYLQGGTLDGSVVGPSGIKAEQMTLAAWDYIFLGKDFNAEACPGLTEEQLRPLRNEFNYWYPMDMRVSGKDLIRNHLTFALYNHQAIWNSPKMMPKSYFCNGYLMLNNEKMSKSTGNFLSMDQCVEKYGADSSRIACADAGDFLDDANFDEQVANAAILKLFTLEQWIQKYVKEGFDFAEAEKTLDDWDRLILNKLNDVNSQSFKAYTDMKFKKVVQYGFNELLSLKETYIIGKSGAPNPLVIMTYVYQQLVIMNPIIPHFCQYNWMHYVLPVLQKSANCSWPMDLHLSKNGWRKVSDSDIDRVKVAQFDYLQDAKHIFRLALDKAKMGGKAKKGKGKQAAETEKAIESCAVFVGLEYPEFQR